MSDCTSDLTNHPNLCHGLRWKGQFIVSERDPSAQTGTDHNFWCMFTQTCIGPDGMNAEPGLCASSIRACHGTGHCE
jgi:hypothetical protein